MAALKIAVAGAGLIGRAHIALIRKSENSALAAIADSLGGAGSSDVRVQRPSGCPHDQPFVKHDTPQQPRHPFR